MLRHTLAITLSGPATITWPLFFRPMHDTMLEQLLDRAESALTGDVAKPAVWSPYVRFPHKLAKVSFPATKAGKETFSGN